MKAREAVQRWALARAEDTLQHFNEVQMRRGLEPTSIDPASVTCDFLVADEVRCCEGHSPENCYSSWAARPVIRVTSRTESGTELRTETHAGDFSIAEFIESVIAVAGEPLTV